MGYKYRNIVSLCASSKNKKILYQTVSRDQYLTTILSLKQHLSLVWQEANNSKTFYFVYFIRLCYINTSVTLTFYIVELEAIVVQPCKIFCVKLIFSQQPNSRLTLEGFLEIRQDNTTKLHSQILISITAIPLHSCCRIWQLGESQKGFIKIPYRFKLPLFPFNVNKKDVWYPIII